MCIGLLLKVLLKYCMKYMLHSLWSVAGCGSLVAMALTYFSPSSTPAWVIRSAMFFSRSSILWPMSSSSLVKEHSMNQDSRNNAKYEKTGTVMPRDLDKYHLE